MRTIEFDVSALRADATTVDGLARLQLTAKRHGIRLRLRNATDELRGLVAFAGLAEALPLEGEGQPEQREERLRVQEKAQLDDPAV